jgi:SAM-dependent methyltransferase
MRELRDHLTSPQMLERMAEVVAERPDLRVTFYILRNHDRVREWAQSVGVALDPRLRALVPPIPPRELREIVSDHELEVFLWTGYLDADLILALYGEHGPDQVRPRILDFGCGCGRITRFLNELGDRCEVHAADANVRHAAWCAENLPRVRTVHNALAPPLPYAAESFELVYTVSVLTHLNAAGGARWLAELERILAPGGLLVVTTHGPGAVEIIRDSPTHQGMFAMTAAEAQEILDGFAERPFAFRPYAGAALEAANAGPEYGNSFVHPSHIEGQWTRGRLELLRILPGGLRGWQDVVVLRRARRP